MRRILAFIILASVKTVSSVLFRGHFNWLNAKPNDHWKKARLFVFLNHTSLYEPIFIQALPYSYLWYLTEHLNVPGADITLNRPIVGRFWKLMMPNIASVSRKKDSTWNKYLESIDDKSIIMIAAEGRMKRPNGLDKFGKPMSVRGGVADIIEGLDDGAMVLCFSGGLHHIQKPGQHLPNFFRHIHMNLSFHDIKEYKAQFSENPRERKIKMVQDIQSRVLRDCPSPTLSK